MNAAQISRNARQHQIDTWLRSNADRVASEDSDVIAKEIREQGLYSQKTSIIDIRSGLLIRCKKLGLKFKGHERK